MAQSKYTPRLVDHHISALHRELSALMITGPRGTGKTTTAIRHASTVIRLDRPAEAQVFKDDPDVALRGLKEPILIDEWQLVPEVLGAIKRTVDDDPHPGRFIITGSVSNEFDGRTWPGTGRLVRVPVWGMTIREQLGRIDTPSLIDQLATGEFSNEINSQYRLDDYIDLALKGGFPEAALSTSNTARESWLESYIDQLLTRDISEAGAVRDRAALRRYFEALASNSAGLPNDKTLYGSAKINAKTASRYNQLLANLLVVEETPAWFSNRLKRLIANPKYYMTDVGLMTGSLQLETTAVLRNGDLLGRVIDTFVASQLRAELATSSTRPRLYHLRQQQGRHEIDLIAELRGQKIIAFEVKSSSAPDKTSAKHLEWLSDQLGDQFIAGVVFHTGPRPYSLGQQIHALPISTLWSA